MSKKVTSKRQKELYSVYKVSSKWKVNRTRKLLAQIKANPNNKAQLEKALSNISYRRKVPKKQIWSKSNIAIVKLVKEFCGKAPVGVLDSKTQEVYRAISKGLNYKTAKDKVSFALKDRV